MPKIKYLTEGHDDGNLPEITLPLSIFLQMLSSLCVLDNSDNMTRINYLKWNFQGILTQQPNMPNSLSDPSVFFASFCVKLYMGAKCKQTRQRKY